MARPRKELTEEQIIQVEALASCLTMEQIADYFGMSQDTLSAICEREPEVLRRYKKGKSGVIYDIANSLITKARDGDTTSQIFFLKTQARWRETSTHEIIGKGDRPVTIELVPITDETGSCNNT